MVNVSVITMFLTHDIEMEIYYACLVSSLIVDQEEFEDTKGVISIHKWKDRQHNGQKEKDKQRSTKHTHKITDRVTRIPLKTRGELRYSGRLSSFSSTSGTRHVNLVTNPVTSHE